MTRKRSFSQSTLGADDAFQRVAQLQDSPLSTASANDTPSRPIKRRRYSPMFIQEEVHLSCDYVLIPGVVDAASDGALGVMTPTAAFSSPATFFDTPERQHDTTLVSQDSHSTPGGEVCSTPQLLRTVHSATPSVNSEGDMSRLEVCQMLQRLSNKSLHQQQRIDDARASSRNFLRWITTTERAEIYDWLVFFARECKRTFVVNGTELERTLSESSAQLAVSYLDRFFTVYDRDYPCQHALIMLSMASFRLACKYNETDDLCPTSVELIEYSTQANITPQNVDQCELILLETLSWELGDVVPCALASTYYRAIREYGIASLTMANIWEQSVQRTNRFLQYKYSTSNLIQVANSVFTCACILLSRLITLSEMHPSVSTQKPTDMIQLLGEDHCWPACWSDILGFQFEDMKECLLLVQKMYLDQKATDGAENATAAQ